MRRNGRHFLLNLSHSEGGQLGLEYPSWGLRGDPYLWQDLVERLRTKSAPENINLFNEIITSEITELLGEPLEKGKDIHVRRYESHGTSSGYISSDFWIDKAIPRLLQLFAQKCLI